MSFAHNAQTNQANLVMDIEFRRHQNKWVIEVWSDDITERFSDELKEPYPEEVYTEINNWCKNSFGYHARTAYHVFELKKRSHLNWFLLRWK